MAAGRWLGDGIRSEAMKLLLFSDLHRDATAARRLVEQAPAFDVIVGAGDFATVRRGLGDVIGILKAIEQPIVLVAGNSETPEELREACASWKNAHVLHGSGVVLEGIPFFGLGGAVPVTPFGSWSFDLTEEQASELLAQCPERAVLVTHSPPKGALDVSSSGRSLGSVAVREVVERRRPRLVVCGHIHQSGGNEARLGESAVVNAGPDGYSWTLDPERT